MTQPEMEAIIRDARADVLAIWNTSTDPQIKTLADRAYKRLSAVLRAGHVVTPGEGDG